MFLRSNVERIALYRFDDTTLYMMLKNDASKVTIFLFPKMQQNALYRRVKTTLTIAQATHHSRR
jgi:hypothetical protein